MKPKLSIDQLLEQVQLKKTIIRKHILSILLEEHSPIDVPVIHKKLTSKGIIADEVTVYRALSSFVEKKLVQEVHLHDGKIRYELSSHHHHHIVCTKCGSVEELNDITICSLESFEKQIMETHKFASVYHSLEFYGLCQKCT